MDILNALFRTVFFYFFVVIAYRIMGKREIGQLSVQDLVVSILIAELVAISIENVEDSLILTVVPVVILVILEIVGSIISLKCNKFRNIMQGKPALIINQGKINFKEMVKQRYTLDDLLIQLRNKNIKSIMDVEYAILENDGKLSVFKYNFLKLKSDNPFPLILDGIVQSDTLKYLKKNERWLKELIKEENVDVKDIFYAFYKNKKAYIIKKNDLIR